jgi:hypothetical protein
MGDDRGRCEGSKAEKAVRAWALPTIQIHFRGD